jgi:tripartite ATP-independent transporter DctP family solute receptor
MRLAAVLLVAALVPSCGDLAEGPLELRFGHVANPTSLGGLSAEEFARRVNERLAGRAHVAVFGSSQLGDDETLLLKLKLGTVDFSMPSTIMSSVVDEFGFFEMPYLVRDRAHVKRIREEIFWKKIAPAAERKGLLMLGLWENGFRQITNNIRPIVGPEDLAGVKLRTPRGRWRIRLFQSYGAHPTPMSLSEVFVALQTGVIDGQENPLTQIQTQKFQEVQRYLSLTNHVYSPSYLATGKERWESLPADVREAVRQAARDTEDWVLETAERLDRELLAELRQEGMEINEADRSRFVAASKTIYEEFGAEVPGGAEWTRQALALAEETPEASPAP